MTELKKEEDQSISDEELVQQFRDLYAVQRDNLPISDQSDKKDVIIELEAMQKMLLHVYEFGNFDDAIKKWKEVYGLLIGKVTNGGLVILDAAPITHGTARGVEFKNKDYIFAAKVNDMLINNEKGEFFVGWYHSHPAIGLFLSGVDLKNQLGYQMVNDVAVAIVFDHCLLIENTIPFKVFRLDDIQFESEDDLGYHVVDYNITGLESEEVLPFTREIHDEIGTELKKTKFKSAEKQFKKEVELKVKEFEKLAKKEHIKYEKTDSKQLKKGRKASDSVKKKGKKKKSKKKKKGKKKVKKKGKKRKKAN